MNYQKHYDNLINRARNRILNSYVESHHIIPKCVGGTNAKSNLVDLTPEEHYVAHQLLVKIYHNEQKLVYALRMMCMAGNGKVKRRNKEYAWVRKIWSKTSSESQLGKPRKPHTEETKRKISEIQIGRPSGMLGKHHTEERNKNLSEKMKGKRTTLKTREGRVNSEEHRRKISESKKGVKRDNFTPHNKGVPMSEEQKKKISETKRLNKLAKSGGSN